MERWVWRSRAGLGPSNLPAVSTATSPPRGWCLSTSWVRINLPLIPLDHHGSIVLSGLREVLELAPIMPGSMSLADMEVMTVPICPPMIQEQFVVTVSHCMWKTNKFTCDVITNLSFHWIIVVINIKSLMHQIFVICPWIYIRTFRRMCTKCKPLIAGNNTAPIFFCLNKLYHPRK